MERRDFIKKSALGSAALVTTLHLPKNEQEKKLKLGLIGAGWYGMIDTTAALKSGGAEVIAVCDVDSEHLKTSADEIEKLQGYRPKTYKYYKDLLELKDLEAVIIGTMPHWHALIFIDACKKGLDIYCEKPLAYDIAEGMAMVDAWKKAGNVVQLGFQRRNSIAFRKVKELIDSGRIGPVYQATAQIHYDPGEQDNTIQPPPASLDWEEWCGPAPKLDYRPNIGHFAWRLEKEYGNGHLVDWGIHHIDVIRKILGETMPTEFQTAGGLNHFKGKITTPDTLTAYMKFKKVPVLWQHRMWGNGDLNSEFKNGIFFYGDNGSIFSTENKVSIFPMGRNAQREDISLPSPTMQEAQVGNFLEAVRKKDKNAVICTPEDAFMSTATVQLAMIAYYTGTLVKWDEQKKEIIGNPAASALLKREYRGKYVHP